jgi:hypothetical protein
MSDLSSEPQKLLLYNPSPFCYYEDSDGDGSHDYAVTALGSGESYVYDANGNMTQRSEGGVIYTQVFDAENRLVSVSVDG